MDILVRNFFSKAMRSLEERLRDSEKKLDLMIPGSQQHTDQVNRIAQLERVGCMALGNKKKR